MSVFLTAAMICAIHEEQSKIQEKKPVILMVPVNLRKIFPSDSMLNFFSHIEPGYRFGEGKDSFDDVLEATKQYFEENLSKEKIAERMNNLIAYEKHKIFLYKEDFEKFAEGLEDAVAVVKSALEGKLPETN